MTSIAVSDLCAGLFTMTFWQIRMHMESHPNGNYSIWLIFSFRHRDLLMISGSNAGRHAAGKRTNLDSHTVEGPAMSNAEASQYSETPNV